jgi:hypothetical protein
METIRRKELLMEYKHRKPEMGIISFRCIATGDVIFYPSKDTKADINGNSFQLGL